MNNLKRQVERNLSTTQKDFASAIDYNALHKAMSNPKSRKEIESILKKARL